MKYKNRQEALKGFSEVKDLNKILKTNLTQPNSLRKNLDNLAELWDNNNELKTVCRRCGGEGAYVMQWMDPKTMDIVKKEVLICEECEDGFKYGILDQGRSSDRRTRNPSSADNQRR